MVDKGTGGVGDRYGEGEGEGWKLEEIGRRNIWETSGEDGVVRDRPLARTTGTGVVSSEERKVDRKIGPEDGVRTVVGSHGVRFLVSGLRDSPGDLLDPSPPPGPPVPGTRPQCLVLDSLSRLSRFDLESFSS